MPEYANEIGYFFLRKMAMCFSHDFSMAQKGNDFVAHAVWLKCYNLINNQFAYMWTLAGAL